MLLNSTHQKYLKLFSKLIQRLSYIDAMICLEIININYKNTKIEKFL